MSYIGRHGILLLLLTAASVSAAQDKGSPWSIKPKPPAGRWERPSFKGIELYSWRKGTSYRFSLLMGTNYVKSVEDVTKPAYTFGDLGELREALGWLAKGEHVFWSNRVQPSEGPHQAALGFPPPELVDEVSAWCTSCTPKPKKNRTSIISV